MTETKSTETLGFQAEVRRLLHLITHAVYSEKEIFLRELISNASDALDKLRFLALGQPEVVDKDAKLGITITVDPVEKTLTVSDTGIGMTREELISNLGTVARSGTAEFVQALDSSQAQGSNLIGKFGIGFYSAFIVAERVVVQSKRAQAEPAQAMRWESRGEGEYQVSPGERASHGTDVTLYLRDEQKEFLDLARLKRVVKIYSDHIGFPITLVDKKTGATDKANRGEALWLRPKRDITQAEYHEFYRQVGHDYREPLTYLHTKIEGKLVYTMLLFIPSRAPYGMWSQEGSHGVRLYVRRVFVASGIKHLFPSYLRFLRGVLESDDMPLNISRELLQHNRIINEIRVGATEKVLAMLENMAAKEPQNYQVFWNEFGEAIKEGVGDDQLNRDTLKRLLRFSTTHVDAPAGQPAEETVSLADYVGRMKPGQKAIYYLVGDSYLTAKTSPLLEVFKKKGVEVLLLHKQNDAWLMSHVSEFEGKHLESVSRAGMSVDDLPSIEGEAKAEEPKPEEKATPADQLKELTQRMQKQLGARVTEVSLSKRLESSPACLLSRGGELRELLSRHKPSWNNASLVFEINPKHVLIQRLASTSDEGLGDWTEILFQQSVLNAGGELENPADFVQRLNRILVELSS